MKEKPETKLCKHCKTEIPYDAKVCPQCRKKQKSSGCLIAVVVAVVIVILAACFGSGGTSDKETKAIVDSNANVSETQENVQAEADSVETSNESADSKAEEETIQEQVLLEWEGLKITAVEMTKDSIWGKGIKLLIENDSDKNLGVGCNALIINNYMITDLFSETVAAGKKSNTNMYFSSNQLEAAGIDDVGEIEIYFHIFDGDSYSTLYDPEKVVIQTSEYANMDTKVNDEGQELLNKDGVRIVGKYVDENSFWGMGVLLYIENTSGKNIGVNCDNMSVNGFMVNPLFSSTVYDGKMALADITLFSSDLEDNGIEEVEDIELTFHVYNADNYQTIFDTDAISFSAK